MAWERGTEIRRIDNPGKIGTTSGQIRNRGSLRYYGVRWQDGSLDYVAEDQLEEIGLVASKDRFELIEAGRYGRSEDLRRSLTHVHLAGRLANLVYSMGVTNTDFYPHQYKPLLTLLESPADGLLIADEVGLGKTIEAGIIWTELRAREDMRRLLIVCPAVLREKWRDELKLRFGIDATIVDARTLADELAHSSTTGAAKAWIASYQALRPPKSWRPGTEPPARKAKAPGRLTLAHFLDEHGEEEPLVDLVVFDEAHYMRNPESAVHRLGEMLQKVSHQRVLLSATPINLHNDDLFYLLQLCDPDHFQYPSSFQELLEANQPLVAARDAALNPISSAATIVEYIQQAAASDLLRNSRQLATLLESPPTEELLAKSDYRAELAASFERINLLGHVITRTRKRDVQLERPRRVVHPEKVPMTVTEEAFYRYVTEVTRDYAWRRGISDGFLLATPQRQVCSCPAAFARAWLGGDSALVEDLAEQIAEEYEETDEERELEDISASLKEFLIAQRPRDFDVDALEHEDSKLQRLIKELKNYLTENPGEKVILFTSFRVTAKYLSERLSSLDIPSMLLWGNMAESKQDLINEFRDRPDLRLLVATEVASEGVDLQFCRLLINYDLPWNPMRVEQRIGRIDRLGQKAEVIHIWNLFYEQTIDERIFSRLLQRLRVFEQALGEPEAIIGETIKQLESRLLTSRLTPAQEEEEIQRAAQALENVRRRQDELERNASQMMAHGGLVLERIAAAQELSRRVTERDLVIYVQDFLNHHASGHQFQQLDASNEFSIQLPASTAADLDDYCRRKGIVGQTMLGNGLPRQCRFLNNVTSASSKAWESIHQFHPLIRFISEQLKELDEAFYPLVSLKVPASDAGNIPPGDYMFALRRWTFSGVREEEWLQSTACGLEHRVPLGDDQADALINLARLQGSDWIEAPNVVPAEVASTCLDTLEIHLDEAYQRAKKRKQDENADRLMFQLHGIDQHLQRRLQTLESVRELHASLGRQGLVRATQGRIDKLRAVMGLKQEQIRRKERVQPDDAPVCAGLIRVE
ncbi:HeliCase, c-terminal:dead/deah box helicase, n-terminal [Cupriavidus necator]|uniref:HeliCase, c-terminal:dead/deah box helicase, n-terminal n=1 Tax=Cupriavidus necator TaxID=106590 RepID=A0A1K0ICN5_CUPNE|nr:HeliCase, c-terminal:dead/deah box helicase, n-terminal [Cupriavidus necator]